MDKNVLDARAEKDIVEKALEPFKDKCERLRTAK
jgi:hypothetical protein